MMMWHMGGAWLLIPMLVFVMFMLGPMRHHWWAGHGRHRREYGHEAEATEREGLQARQQRDQVEELERRVAELESGLDFAERLLVSRREPQELPRPSALQ